MSELNTKYYYEDLVVRSATIKVAYPSMVATLSLRLETKDGCVISITNGYRSSSDFYGTIPGDSQVRFNGIDAFVGKIVAGPDIGQSATYPRIYRGVIQNLMFPDGSSGSGDFIFEVQ